MAKDGRLHIRLVAEEAEWLRAYARRNRTTVTQIISDHVKDLQRLEAFTDEYITIDAKQI